MRTKPRPHHRLPTFYNATMFPGTIFVLLLVLSCQRIFPQRNTTPTDHDSVDAVYTCHRRTFNKTFSHPSHGCTRPLLVLALLLSGDIQTNPGPRVKNIFPCGFCSLAVDGCTSPMRCDECRIWYHRSCLETGLGGSGFGPSSSGSGAGSSSGSSSSGSGSGSSSLHRSNVAWICCRCNSTNVDSFTFRSYEISPSYYEPISDGSIDSEIPSPTFDPLFTSSPQSNALNGKRTRKTPQNSRHSGQAASQRSHSSSVFDLPEKTNLRVLTINCQSLRNKRADLEATINYAKPDIICGCESWLSSDINSSEVFPDGYVAYRKDRRTTTTGGGVFILVRQDVISSAEPSLDSDCEITWAKVQLANRKEILIGSYYMPHRREKDLKEMQKSLQQATHSGRPRQVLLCGDFNCPDVEWETGTVPAGVPDRPTQQLLIDISEEAHLTQVHAEPTRDDNVLELVFTTNPTLVKNSSSVPGIGDHAAVVTDFDSRVYYQKQRPRKIHQFARANWEDLDADLAKMSLEVQEAYDCGADVETLWTVFKDSIKMAVDKHVPSRMSGKKKNIPWLNADIRKLLKRKKRLYAKARKSGNWANYKFVQKKCRKKLRSSEWDHINTIITDGLKTNNSKPFWRYIKSRKQDNIGVAPLKKNGSLVSDTKAKAEILVDQFKSVFTRDSNAPMPHLDTPNRPDAADIKVDTAGICKLLKKINPAKASGPDQIPNAVLQKCAETLAPALRDVFQRSLDTGDLPADWRKANVSCAFKKGDKHQAENYRPISLTSVCCKLLEHIVSHHLLSYLDQHRVLTDLNHGFRAGFSCETQLVTTLRDLFTSYDSSTQVDLAVLDFSKAFDTVPHQKLLHKLAHYGVKGTTHQWIGNFLTNRTMKVVLDGEESREVTVDSGVPQGTVLGPLLFLCHINDLPVTVKSQVRLFADDCLLYREIHTFNDHIALQEDLKKLETWAQDWGMRFNAKKCNILSIKKKSDFRYQLCGEILSDVTGSPYLGVTISNDLKWHDHISNKTKKANSVLGLLKRNLRYCPHNCKRTAYVTLVRPILEYAAIIWDPHLKGDIDKIERIQHRAARFITGDYRTRQPGCVTAMLRNLQLPSLQSRRCETRLLFLFRVVEGLVPALPPVHFLKTRDTNKRRVKPKKFIDCVTTNIVEKYATNNSRCLKLPEWNTEEPQNSFFFRTAIEWNALSEDQVQAKTPEEFRQRLRGLRAQ